MDDKTQKERLEQELRFLKESYEAEVISKEEYEKGRDRIDKKLKEIQNLEKNQNSEIKDEKIEEAAKAEDVNKDDLISNKEDGKIKLNVIQDDIEERKEDGPIQNSEKIILTEDKKNKSKFMRYAVIFLVLLLILFFSYSYFKNNKETKIQQKELQSSDLKFSKPIQKINVIVLNDMKKCFNCDASRVLSILESWFDAINEREIDINTNEGKNLSEKFEISLLPAFILDNNVSTKPRFDELKQIFVEKEDGYLLSKEVAGSTFYFRREYMPNRLDLFVIAGDEASIKAEKNLQEFLNSFKEVKFNKYVSNDALTKELGIKTFPTFLINNQIRFSGIHTAETIKENFCKMNKMPECEKSLSQNLV